MYQKIKENPSSLVSVLANPVNGKLLKPISRSRAEGQGRWRQTFSTPTETSPDRDNNQNTFEFHVKGIKKPMLLTDRESPRLVAQRKSVEAKPTAVTMRPAPILKLAKKPEFSSVPELDSL